MEKYGMRIKVYVSGVEVKQLNGGQKTWSPGKDQMWRDCLTEFFRAKGRKINSIDVIEQDRGISGNGGPLTEYKLMVTLTDKPIQSKTVLKFSDDQIRDLYIQLRARWGHDLTLDELKRLFGITDVSFVKQ